MNIYVKTKKDTDELVGFTIYLLTKDEMESLKIVLDGAVAPLSCTMGSGKALVDTLLLRDKVVKALEFEHKRPVVPAPKMGDAATSPAPTIGIGQSMPEPAHKQPAPVYTPAAPRPSNMTWEGKIKMICDGDLMKKIASFLKVHVETLANYILNDDPIMSHMDIQIVIAKHLGCDTIKILS